MSVMPLGNLAQSMVARHAQTRIQSDLTRLSLELTTGLTQDVGETTRGDTRALTALNHQLTDLDAYNTARSEAALLARSTQAGLDSMRTRLGHVNEGVAVLSQTRDPAQHAMLKEQARADFIGIVGDLNTQVAGRNLFSGTTQDGLTMRAAEGILADITSAISGVTTSTDFDAALDAYFAAGGAFESNDYLGSTVDIQPIRISPQERVEPTVRADHPAVRETLKSLAHLITLSETNLSEGEQKISIDRIMGGFLEADRALIEVKSGIGTAEARIDLSASRSAGERAAYDTARLDILGIDSYATATRLEQTQTQLQTLYTITARLSGLNLVNFL